MTAKNKNLTFLFVLIMIAAFALTACTSSLTLQNGSTLTGAINTANTTKAINLTLDSSSSWNVTADSYLSCLTDTSGINGNSVSNIIGNGHTVYYDAKACSALGGLSYSLSGGGSLMPAP
jgi:hypothetical protein